MLRQITGGARRRSDGAPSARHRTPARGGSHRPAVLLGTDCLVAEALHRELEQSAHVVVRLCDQDTGDHAVSSAGLAFAPRMSTCTNTKAAARIARNIGRARTGGRRCAGQSQRLRTDDVLRLRAPDVRRGAVVAAHDETVLRVAADDPVDHLRARHRVALRHAVGNELACVIARMLLDEHEVAGVVARLHALARDEHVAGVASERLRPQELRPEQTEENCDCNPGRLVRARERLADPERRRDDPISHS